MIIRKLGICHYQQVWADMIEFTRQRNDATVDEIWLLQHYPVFTQGTSCLTTPRQHGNDIPVIHSDRGGQITYHGPGQLVAYMLINIKRLGTGPKSLVNKVEQIMIEFLLSYGVQGCRSPGAPGVYVEDAKIAALGLRISRGCSYHGLSINIDMDMSPYDDIDPCGYPGLKVTQLMDHVTEIDFSEVESRFEYTLNNAFN